MGKIRSGLRRVVKEIMKKYRDKVTTDFEKNIALRFSKSFENM